MYLLNIQRSQSFIFESVWSFWDKHVAVTRMPFSVYEVLKQMPVDTTYSIASDVIQ